MLPGERKARASYLRHYSGKRHTGLDGFEVLWQRNQFNWTSNRRTSERSKMLPVEQIVAVGTKVRQRFRPAFAPRVNVSNLCGSMIGEKRDNEHEEIRHESGQV